MAYPREQPRFRPRVGAGWPADEAAMRRSAAYALQETLKHEMFDQPAPPGRRPMTLRDSDAGASAERHEEIPIGVSDVYVVLDAGVCDRASNFARGHFLYNLAAPGASSSAGGEMRLGAVHRPDRVIELVFGRWPLPDLPETPYVVNAVANATLPRLVDNVGTQPAITQLVHGGRLTLQIEAAQNEAVSDDRSAHHHVEFDVVEDGGRAYAVPVPGFERYVFTHPLTELANLNVQFFNPYEPVAFPPARFFEVLATGAGGGLLRLRAEDATLATGDLVQIVNFACDDAVITQWVNRRAGHAVGNLTPGVGFGLDPDVDVSGLGWNDGETIGTTTTLTGIVNVVGADLTALNGIGTAFTTELQRGDLVRLGAVNVTVASIQSDVLLTLTAPHVIGIWNPYLRVKPSRALVWIPKNRFRVPMRIRRLVRGETNHITAV